VINGGGRFMKFTDFTTPAAAPPTRGYARGIPGFTPVHEAGEQRKMSTESEVTR